MPFPFVPATCPIPELPGGGGTTAPPPEPQFQLLRQEISPPEPFPAGVFGARLVRDDFPYKFIGGYMSAAPPPSPPPPLKEKGGIPRTGTHTEGPGGPEGGGGIGGRYLTPEERISCFGFYKFLSLSVLPLFPRVNYLKNFLLLLVSMKPHGDNQMLTVLNILITASPKIIGLIPVSVLTLPGFFPSSFFLCSLF